ncbi:hypothetical protein [Prevotella intermedia]|uniref:DUF1566 domain-containing protein n=1 Tax=Prevotella intermedia TaxID=28131 RepID=A0A2G9IFM2_PREIN|nr:hypothetical protein [Prevotella intermedia]PIN28571.1 hypothetical protein CUC04_03680 [Prevotella intermedia]
MKKALSIIFAAMLALGASAQNTHDIVVWHGTQSQTIQAVDSITFVESKVEPTYVDLGLSIKWGTCNIGAKNPEDFGNFYQWGDVATKESYDWDTYKYGTDRTNLEKYNVKDGKTVLDPEDDAAIVNLGEGWRMPTPAEIKELVDNCTWEWTTVNNVKGYKVTAKNDNSIFLPAAGVMFTKNPYYGGQYGYYLSNTLREGEESYVKMYAQGFSFQSDKYQTDDRIARNYGITVRPVHK